MRQGILILILFLPGSVFSQNVSKKLNVLFLGNSYTYVNNLPQLLYDLALANNDTLFFDSNTPGGYTLQNHAANATSIAKINAQKWDHVILQTQSQEPSIDPLQVAALTTPYVMKLDSIIKQNDSCTLTTLYETWGRKYGDATNCGTYPPVCTYAGMQDRLKRSYKLFADTTGGILSPVGEAFRLSRQLDSSINLYQSDYSHPSLEGSFLAACVFYEVLFHKNSVGNSYVAGLNVAVAGFLQQVAHTTVSDSLLVWNLGVNVPYAPFTFTGTGLQYQFAATGNFAHQWYFGDGNTSTQNSPLYTYSVSQTYTVSHVVSNACVKDSFSMVLISGVSEVSALSTEKINLYPNPAHNEIYITRSLSHPGSCRIKICNLLGALVKEIRIEKENGTISIAELSPGCYFMNVEGSLQRTRFIKE